MKYRVYVKEIWLQPYVVEAKSKAHAKNLVDTARNQFVSQVQKEGSRLQRWGVIGAENWEVEEIR